MQLFYTTAITEGIARLQEEEAQHCLRTLRKTVGDAIQWIDGNGGWYEGTIIHTTKKDCTLSVTSYRAVPQLQPYIHLAVAPTKNIDRWEWLLEKATEIGVNAITPLLCQRSERRTLRLDRSNAVLVAAMKQSLKAHLPTLHPPIELHHFISQPAVQAATHRFVAHCDMGDKLWLGDVALPITSAVVLIGPEGDFSPQEIGETLAANFHAITLGAARLRTETAGLAALCMLRMLTKSG